MARTAITRKNLVPNGAWIEDFGGSIDATNGMSLARSEPERTLIRYTNTHASNAYSIILRAGDKPAASAAGQGDLTVQVAAQGTVWLGPFDSSRFIQSDGSLEIDFTSGAVGGITVFYVPKNT